jgi:2-dehydro-3-deoxyphosphogluconate aldolase/(4S)-4-hydroxy-2-oxoglutarate aldolase
VVEAARGVGLPFIPGVLTPSEVERALAMGFRLLKFFPAEAAGGVRLLQALAGPYRHTGVRFIPLGGINLSNLSAYLALPMVAAVGGTWFLASAAIALRDWPGIAKQAGEAVTAAGAAGGAAPSRRR